MTRTAPILIVALVFYVGLNRVAGDESNGRAARILRVQHDEPAGTIAVFRAGESLPILTQQARADFRPYIHPIVAPDGRGVVTGTAPEEHNHQTGLFCAFPQVNGRDYFRHPEGDYWRRVSATVIIQESRAAGEVVQWQTVYDLLDDGGNAVLRESQIWTMHERDSAYVLDVQWAGEAQTDVTIGQSDSGGLFLQMPWQKGASGRIVNNARQVGQRADGQRALWVDAGLQTAGRDNLVHVALFDHPANRGFPQAWSVGERFGVGAARAKSGDWAISQGQKALVEHRLLVYAGDLSDVELTARWSQYTGQRDYAQWLVARQEGRAAEFLTPEKAVAAMTVHEGFEVNVFASEPMITQPMAFCWDDRGRLWIAENRDYETRSAGFANSGDSRILILEDADHDGVAENRKVFAEGIPFPSALAVGFGGVWLGAPPNLLFVPDRNDDDKADTDDIEVRLTGWGIRDRHETLNSFHWGPDGWLYGLQGVATPSTVGKPAGKGRLFKKGEPYPANIALEGRPVEIDGGVWRYHPTRDVFEVVAHGFSNPWGIDYDAKGQLFITACVIPHLWHVVPGGYYHRQAGSHFNHHVYSDIPTIADHRHRSAHGGARIYLSDAFPEEHRGRIFMANLHEHAVLSDVLEPSGSGFVGRHGDDFLLANNAQWIGFSVEIGPEGALYVLDWHDADICGMDVLNKDTGRVFRIAPRKTRAIAWPGRFDDLSKASDVALADLQQSPSEWHARRARVILQGRAARRNLAPEALQTLRNMYAIHANADYRLRALWALWIVGGMSESELVGALTDDDPHVRAWAVQFLCEERRPSAVAREQFAMLARSDQSPVVRLYLAAALPRIEPQFRWDIINALVLHAEDARDHNLPRMIWYGLEPLAAEIPARALELVAHSKIPLIARHVARRLTDAGALEPLVGAIGQAAANRYELLLGLHDGLEGRYDVPAPSNWAHVLRQLEAAGGEVAQIGVQLSQQFGDAAAAGQLLATLKDPQADVARRREALQGLAGRKNPQLRALLPQLLDDDALRRDAIRAIAAFDDIQLARALLQRYSKFAAEEKLDAIHTLAARSSSGSELTQAIKRGDVARRDVPAYVARLLHRVVGHSFIDVWGPLETFSADKEALFSKYRGLLTSAALSQADAGRGRLVFQRTCAACHKMYGEGGVIGPDITGANRANLEYLLGNILTPSAEIQDAYRMQIVVTNDGRIYSGIPAEENDRQLKLRVANQAEPVVIARSQIESRQIAPVSMMPEGLLSNLADAEVLDLVAYLQTQQQAKATE
ncbi:MAG: PVC-type heme-binding CxxCH protein [Planctomycetaceae bacterium]